jgi:hypothetical protein
MRVSSALAAALLISTLPTNAQGEEGAGDSALTAEKRAGDS